MGAHDPPAWTGLVTEAWRQHYREPQQLVPLGLAIVETAGEGSAAAALGWLHVAQGRRFLGEPEPAQQALAQGLRLAQRWADERALAQARDLQSMIWAAAGRHAEALALLEANRTLPQKLRSAYERGMTHQRRAPLLDALGRRDDALRERYAQLACARETGDDAVVAYALGMLCGTHADLFNLEEADRLGAEGAALAERNDAFLAWTLASLNRLNALVNLGRGASALPIVAALEAAEPRMNARAREQRLIVYADCYAQAGQVGRAQALLDESLQRRSEISSSPLSWATVQLLTQLASGRCADARTTGEAYLAQPRRGTEPDSVPSELLRLLQGLARACEALGDPGAALAYQRRAFDTHELLVGRSARARRLTLEIEHQLERERWQREQAQARQAAAEAEGARLDALNRALAEASAAKTRFLAAASHDLRQPVQALAMYLAALHREPAGAGQNVLLQRMGQSLQALVAMFDTLMDISRLDAGIVAACPQPVALAPLLQRLADEHRAACAERGLRLHLHLPQRRCAEVPALAQSDPVLLERCLRNLLDNAQKYTARGGVLLALRAVAAGWSVEVIDSGIGMADAVRERAFDEFFQADNPGRDRSRGLGLGLSLVQRMARLLGHPIELASRPGHGTRVRLLLPALSGQRLPPEAAEPAPVEDAPLTLAVLDDDAQVRDGLAAVLERWGHHVYAAAEPAALLDAWQRAGRPPLHAVLADLRLADGSTGIEAVAALRAQTGAPSAQRALPALIITGDIAPERLQLLRDSGLPWLPKPVMPMRLRSWLASIPSPTLDDNA